MISFRIKLLVVMLWAVLVAAAAVASVASGIDVRGLPEELRAELSGYPFSSALIVYAILLSFRPFFLLPSSWIGLAGAYAFGPVIGGAVALIGHTVSAVSVFAFTRFVAGDWVHAHESPRLKKWEAALRRNGLVSVTVMRLVMLPFDPVSAACGVTEVRFKHFALGTFIGSIPSVFAIAILGATLSGEFDGETALLGVVLPFRAILLFTSALLCVGIAVLSYALKDVALSSSSSRSSEPRA